MKLIQYNPYRIATILANSTEKERQKQKSKITKYASIGKKVDSELDFPFLGNIDRSESSILIAFSGIEQNQDKVSHSLFWFLNSNPSDQTAIDYLIKGDKEKAVEIWEKLTNAKEVTSKNYSCFNNLGTLKLFSDSKDEIKEGIEAKIKLIESPRFKDFVLAVADQTYTIDNQKQSEKFVDDVLKQFKRKYSTEETIKLFSNCNGRTQKYLTQKITEDRLQKIDNQIESTKNKRKTNKSGANELGIRLFVNCKDDLAILKSLLGTSNLNYKMIADNLAKEIMQCGIDYFKEWQESKDPSEEGIKLLNYAKSISVNCETNDRINSNIQGMEEFKEKEINDAIILLKHINETYLTNKENITRQAKSMWLPPNQTINWAKVNEIIEKSIDWNKVIESVLKFIPPVNVNKIKTIQNPTKLKEFQTLLNFLLKKLKFSQIIQIRYIYYWKTDSFLSNIIFWITIIPTWIKVIFIIISFLIIAIISEN
jgi:hypothetical protein